MVDKMSTRRRFIQGIVAAGTASGFSGLTAASPDSSEDLPISTSGIRLHQIQKHQREGYYSHETKFLSRDLEVRYDVGNLRVEEDGIPVQAVENKVDSLLNSTGEFSPTDSIPTTTEKFDQITTINDIKNSDSAELINSQPAVATDGSLLFAHKDTTVVGTPDEFARAEPSTQDLAPTNHWTEYSGPRWVFSVDENKNIEEAKSPINVAWFEDSVREPYGSAQQIKSYMEDQGWQQFEFLPSDDRYIMVITGDRDRGIPDYELRKEDATISARESWRFPWIQTHLRAYDIHDWDANTAHVCAQAHYDPFDHGKGSEKPWVPRYPPEVDWKFDESRDKAKKTWTNNGWSVEMVDINNNTYGDQEFDSSDGRIAQIH